MGSSESPVGALADAAPEMMLADALGWTLSDAGDKDGNCSWYFAGFFEGPSVGLGAGWEDGVRLGAVTTAGTVGLGAG